MNVVSVLAQGIDMLDRSIGLQLTTMLGSLGAAGAAVFVTHSFIAFLKNKENAHTRIISEFQDSYADSQKKFQDQLEGWSNRQQANQHDFQLQISRMSDAQNEILRDAIVTMIRSENTIDGSPTTTGIERTIGSLDLPSYANGFSLCKSKAD